MTAMHREGFTAIAEQIESAGAIVWWRLNGGFDLRALREAWAHEGLAEAWLPAAPSPATALRRALNDERRGRRLVRTLRSGMLVLVEEHEVEGELVYANVLRVDIDKVGRLRFDRVHDEEARARIADAYDANLDALIAADISPWLARMMDRLRAVTLRDSGGVYFVPRFTIPEWEKVVRAVRATSAHVISYVPALRSDEAAAAVLDALAVETAAAVENINAQIPDLGVRALQARIGAADAINEKVSRYEAVFETQLETLRARVMQLRAGLTVAMTQAELAEEQECARS